MISMILLLIIIITMIMCVCVCEAVKRWPNNLNVQASLEAGLEGAAILNKRTPKDVMLYTVQRHNSFHDGAPMTFLQVIAEIPNIDAEFKIHRRDQCFNSRTCHNSGEWSYQARFWKFV